MGEAARGCGAGAVRETKLADCYCVRCHRRMECVTILDEGVCSGWLCATCSVVYQISVHIDMLRPRYA